MRLEQAAARDWSQTAGSVWLDANQIWEHMSNNTNRLRAATRIDWGELRRPGAVVLALGCGSSWLTATISRRQEVVRVLAWDSSSRLPGEVLPRMISLRESDLQKVEAVSGDFMLLLMESDSAIWS